jgi:Tfp pilus assembly protein PilN
VSQKPLPPLHFEWTPGHVRAVNITTGQTAEATTVSGLGPILNGQPQALVGVGHSHIFLKSVRLPKATAQDTRNILGVQIGQMFPLPADQLSFDFIQTDDQTVEGWLTVVGAIRSNDLREIRAEMRQAGLTPLLIMPLSLASAAVAARAGRTDGLIVERGRAGLTLDVVQGGVLRFQRIAPLDSDPASEAQRTLAAARAEDLPFITVGTVNLPQAVPSLDTSLGVLHEAPPFNFELAEDRVREFQKQVAARTRLAVLMTMSALLLMLLVWVDRQKAAAVVTHSQGVWARQLTTLESIQTAETAAATQEVAVQNTLQRAYSPAQPLSDISAVVDDSLTPGAWLTGLTMERGKPLDIRGTSKTAGDVTRFVNALSSSSRFRDVRLVFANSAVVGKVPVVQFNVSAVCVGNLPMPTPVTAGRTRTATTASASTGTGESG